MVGGRGNGEEWCSGSGVGTEQLLTTMLKELKRIKLRGGCK